MICPVFIVSCFFFFTFFFFFFSSRRRHTRLQGDWSSDVCSSDLANVLVEMEQLNLVPGDSRKSGEGLEALELGRPSRRNDSRLALLANRTADGHRSLL